MKLETLDDIKDLITSDTETEKIEFKGIVPFLMVKAVRCCSE